MSSVSSTTELPSNDHLGLRPSPLYFMRIGGWNVEGFSEAKQDAAIAYAVTADLDAICLYETWFRQPGISPPRHALWSRLDVISEQSNSRARRGKGGISLLFSQSVNASVAVKCPHSRWCIWITSQATIAGVYLEPSLDLSVYERTLQELAVAILSTHSRARRPTIVVGDFNARLGNITGDHANNCRKEATLSFVSAGELFLLNIKIRSNPMRWTWIAERGRSIPDLALAHDSPCATVDVVDAPVPTPHRLTIVTTAVEAAEIVTDPERWNWSRRAFSDRDRRSQCATLLSPVMLFLKKLWLFIGKEMDSQLSVIDSDTEEMDRVAQTLVDEAYDLTCRAVRGALVGMACWSPATARRRHQVQRHVDWETMASTSNSFFLSKVKNVLNSSRAEQAQNLELSEHPTVGQFGACYRKLFAAAPDSPREPFCRQRRLMSSLVDFELFAFGDIEGLLKRAEWGKAIGPDNLPADVFKCCRKASGPMLQVMFKIFWAHQIMPSVWRGAFINPIPKPGSDLRDPEQWRGIALQSHLKKLFEVCIRKMCRDQKWTETHILQTGFQPRTGAIEAVYAVDELTRKYESIGKPLSVALLDVRKAYDRTPRAFVFRKLRARGMPDHAVGVIQALMDTCTVRIRIGADLSDPIPVELGVPQGDVLSPDMFNLFVDDLPERLIRVCSEFGGCPKYGGVSIPIVMYADDQTLLHWRPEAMQAMLREVEAYAAEHQYVYNVRKCEISHPVRNGDWPSLLLYEQPIPVVQATKLLGVKLTSGRIDHASQLQAQLVQADRAMAGLDMLGALRTPALSIAKKRLLLTAYGRSRIEYGLAIGPHTQAALAPVDTFMRQQTGKLFGYNQGTMLTMRFCGIVPVASRMSQLRMHFVHALRSRSRSSATGSLACGVYSHAKADRSSALNNMVQRLPVYDTSLKLVRKYVSSFRDTFQAPPDDDQLASIERHATNVALRHHAWRTQERHSKLLKLQAQDYNKPHPVAYCEGDGGILVARWLTNKIPGSSYPCPNCNGQYLVSRYHICRCTDAAVRLGEFYCPIVHAEFLSKTDNVLDAMLMDMVPKTDRREFIQEQMDRCPYKPKRRRPPAGLPGPPVVVPVFSCGYLPGPSPWRNPEWTARVTGIGCAIAEIRSRCSLRQGAQALPQGGGSQIDYQHNNADLATSNDHAVGPQAFSSQAGSFTAEDPRASSPVRLPAR